MIIKSFLFTAFIVYFAFSVSGQNLSSDVKQELKSSSTVRGEKENYHVVNDNNISNELKLGSTTDGVLNKEEILLLIKKKSLTLLVPQLKAINSIDQVPIDIEKTNPDSAIREGNGQ